MLSDVHVVHQGSSSKKTGGARHEPYFHTDHKTYAYTPDGGYKVFDPRGQTKQAFEQQVRDFFEPWEKDQILAQKQNQANEKQWKATFENIAKTLPPTPLNTSYRAPKDPNKDGTTWDSFDICFKREDVEVGENAAQYRQQIFDAVVEFCKTVHTPENKGEVRAFTIQDWHGLGGATAEPHLRIQMQRVSWEPAYQIELVPTQAGNVLVGKTGRRMVYSKNNEMAMDFIHGLQPILEEKVGLKPNALRYNVTAATTSPQQIEAKKFAMERPEDLSAEAHKLYEKATTPQNVADVVNELGMNVDGLNIDPQDPTKLRVETPVDAVVAEEYDLLLKQKNKVMLLKSSSLFMQANDQKQEEIDQLNTQLHDVNVEKQQLTQMIETNDKKLAEQDQLIEKHQTVLQELPGLVAELSIELSESATPEEMAVAVVAFKDKVVETSELNAQLAQQNTDLQSNLKETTSQLETAQTALAKTTVELEQQNIVVGQLVEVINQSAKNVGVEISESPIETLNNTIGHSSQEVAALKAQYNDLQKSLEAMAKRLGVEVGQSAEETFANVEKQTQTTVAQVEVLTTLNKQATTDRAQAEKERDEAFAQRDTFEQEAHQAKQAAEVQSKQLSRMSSFTDYDAAILNEKIKDQNDIFVNILSVSKDENVKKLVKEAQALLRSREDHMSILQSFIDLGMPIRGHATEEKLQDFNNAIKKIKSEEGKYFKPIEDLMKKAQASAENKQSQDHNQSTQQRRS